MTTTTETAIRTHKSTREQLINALTICIERAPDEQAEALFDALQDFRDLRGPGLDRALKTQPLAELLFGAIDEGLTAQHIGHAIEKEEAEAHRQVIEFADGRREQS